MAIFPLQDYTPKVKSSLFLALFLVLAFSTLARADYTGTVVAAKHLTGGGYAVYLDGDETSAKMTLYVAPKDLKTLGPVPPIGAKVTATGAEIKRKLRREIKILSADQWKW